jgi:hypothetical protein
MIVATPDLYPGLDPTGVNDSTDALQAWVDSIPAHETGALPAGRYRVRKPLAVGRDIHLRIKNALFKNTEGAS